MPTGASSPRYTATIPLVSRALALFVALTSVPVLLVVPVGAVGASETGEAGTPGGSAPADAAEGAAADAIVVTRTVALDPEPGRIGVTVEYALPASVRSFSTTLPAVAEGRATVVAADGLTRTAAGRRGSPTGRSSA